MKKFLKHVSVFLALFFMISIFTGINVNADTSAKKLDVLFTHDTHSHLNSFSTVVGGEEFEGGGFARIKTIIDEKKSEDPDTLLLDGGDFSMGTLIQTVYEEEASELRMLGSIGCDVTTLGNHEYDYRAKGLSSMLKTAVDSKDKIPAIVISNVDWDTMEAEGLTDDQKKLKDAFDYYGIKNYTVIEKGGVKIAVMGIFGKDALGCAPTCVLKFKDIVEAAKETVAEIKANEDVDMIACVSHTGTWSDEKKSEDEILAKNVPEIDLIISGHTHTTLEEPICHGDTYIVSCGEYGKNIGSLSMEQKEDGRWNVTNYEIIPITSDITPDKATQNKIDAFMDTVDEKYLKDFGYKRLEVLATNDVKFSSQDETATVHEENNLGDIMSDSYRYAVENSSDFNGIHVDAAVVPSGTIRDTYTTGDITTEQVYNSFSLGIGPDGIPGYPLIDVYLTGKELKTVAEIDASISDFMTTTRLYMSGLSFSFNPHRLILNKVTDCYLTNDDGSRNEIENDKLYRVVADLYSGQMLSSVTKMSKGLLSIVPKNADGTPITDFEDSIIMENGKELKAWDAIARYMKSFEDTNGDGIGEVPQYYGTKHDRKVVEDTWNIVSLLKNPNKFSAIIFGAVVAVIIIIILVIRLIRKIFRKRRRSTYKM